MYMYFDIWNSFASFFLSGVIKIEVHTRGSKCAAPMAAVQLHQELDDLRNRTKPWSHQTDKLISRFREEGIEILNSHVDRQTVIVWIWCHLQAALDRIQRVYESNQLRDVLFENIQPNVSKVTNISRNQFKKTVGKSLWRHSLRRTPKHAINIWLLSMNKARRVLTRTGKGGYLCAWRENELKWKLLKRAWAHSYWVRTFINHESFKRPNWISN